MYIDTKLYYPKHTNEIAGCEKRVDEIGKHYQSGRFIWTAFQALTFALLVSLRAMMMGCSPCLTIILMISISLLHLLFFWYICMCIYLYARKYELYVSVLVMCDVWFLQRVHLIQNEPKWRVHPGVHIYSILYYKHTRNKHNWTTFRWNTHQRMNDRTNKHVSYLRKSNYAAFAYWLGFKCENKRTSAHTRIAR